MNLPPSYDASSSSPKLSNSSDGFFFFFPLSGLLFPLFSKAAEDNGEEFDADDGN